MNRYGRRIYYDKSTGLILVDTGEFSTIAPRNTIDEDIQNYTVLSERNRDSFDVLELEFGQYAADFAQCNGYRVNPETLELEFSYLDPNATEPQEPVYQKPLSEQIEETKEAIAELTLLITTMTGGV
jgi:hypothetical protein